jgi:hypothetical protein
VTGLRALSVGFLTPFLFYFILSISRFHQRHQSTSVILFFLFYREQSTINLEESLTMIFNLQKGGPNIFVAATPLQISHHWQP